MTGLDYLAVCFLIIAFFAFLLDCCNKKTIFGVELKALGLMFLTAAFLVGHIHIS